MDLFFLVVSRIAIKRAIDEDVWCWKNQEIDGIQTKCRLLLCWFYAKKTWVDHLLPKLPEILRNDLYKEMCAMLERVTDDNFNRAYQRVKTKYANNASVLRYIEQGWTWDNSPWKLMWPRWARVFMHRYANTTNFVERMWQYVKYTLLDGKIIWRLDELIFALIGNPDFGRRFGGLTLDEHYNNVHWLSESRKYSIRGGEKSKTVRLQKAKKLVQRYEGDWSTNLEIIDPCHLEFAFRS